MPTGTKFQAGLNCFGETLVRERTRTASGLAWLRRLGLLVSQVNYWNSNVNEVQGVVIDQEGKAVHRLFGKWHEGLYCGVAPSAKCIWRPGEN